MSCILFFAVGDNRWRHREQNVGAIHPVDMRYHRVKSTGGGILEAQVLLDRFMKKLNRPAEPIIMHPKNWTRK